MRTLLVGCLVLTACSMPELSAGGAQVQWSDGDPAGCRTVATLHELEGGGLRTYASNKTAAEARLRNEAARRGANAMVLLAEVHGNSEEGARAFDNGVPGLSTPNARCTNCVALMARAYACSSLPALPVAEPPEVKPAPPVVVAPPPEPVVQPPVQPAPIYVVPAPETPPVIIIIQPEAGPEKK